MMQPWPTVNQAFMLLKQEEKQRQIHNATNSHISLMVNLPKPNSAPYSNHRSQDKLSSPLECSYCHLKGHIREKYYKLVGYPADHPYHPNNRGKKRPYTKPSVANQQNDKTGHVLQVSAEPTGCPSSTTSLSTQMEALQNQMNNLM